MSERSAFLNAIVAVPEADAPRLIFADWLEENGGAERAAFIRYQVALGIPKSRLFSHHLLETLRRRFSLPWTGGVPGDQNPVWPCGFERGFVRRVLLRRPDHAAALAQVLESEPVGEIHFSEGVAALDLNGMSARALESLKGVSSLCLDADFPQRQDAFDAIAGVRSLHVLKAAEGRELTIGRFPTVERLTCSELGPDSVERVAESCGELRSLGVRSWNNLGDSLGRLPAPPSLESLSLFGVFRHHQALGDHLAPFVGSAIRDLELGRVVGDDLPVWPGVGRLERLKFDSLWSSEAPPLAPDEGWLTRLALETPELRELSLNDRISPSSALPGGVWRRLEWLELGASADPNLLGIFAALLPRLSELRLRTIFARDFRRLIGLASTAGELRYLAVNGCHADAIFELARPGRLPRLEVLDLAGTRYSLRSGNPTLAAQGLTVAHIEALAGAGFAANLRALDLGVIKDSAVAAAAIRHFGRRCSAYWYGEW